MLPKHVTLKIFFFLLSSLFFWNVVPVTQAADPVLIQELVRKEALQHAQQKQQNSTNTAELAQNQIQPDQAVAKKNAAKIYPDEQIYSWWGGHVSFHRINNSYYLRIK